MKIKRKSLVLVSLLAATAMALVGCSSPTTPATASGASSFNAAVDGIVNPSTVKGGTVKLLSSTDCDSWDPQNTYYGWCWNMQRLFTRSLLGYQKVNGSKPVLAPDLATDMLFPRDGYSIARDDKDPAKAWDIKLKPTYERAIGRLNKRSKGVDRAVFVSLDLGRQIVRMSPKKKAWKEALWRVKHSSLSFTIDGRAQKIDIAEMVAYRGNWYVTQLR